MTGPQTESGETPPRKRIAVACGRCRKRKIRCSGDPGGGQACSNCKNAGAEVCQFLRVSSTEAPLRSHGDFSYELNAARAYANHRDAPPASPYSSDLSTGDLVGAYRGGSMYPYTTKSYYSNLPGCYGSYPEDNVDYGLSCSNYPVLNHDPSHIVPYQWASRAKQTASSGIYVDPEAGYSYGSTTNLVHRPASSASESPGFSMSSFASALPSSGAERLLPTPVSRSLTSSAAASSGSGSYRTDGLPASYKPASTSAHALASPTIPTADTAAAAYPGTAAQTATADEPAISTYSTSLPSHHRASYTSADVYSTGEGLFSEQERGLTTQGSGGVDLAGYSYGGSSSSLRRGSSTSGATASTSSATLSNGQAYIPNESPHLPSHHNVTAVSSVAATAGYAGEVGTTSGRGRGGSNGAGNSDPHRGSVGGNRR